MTAYRHFDTYPGIQPIEEPLSIDRHPQVVRDYINCALDKLEAHLGNPNRRMNVSLVTFADHISPNTGTSAVVNWMLSHSGFVETNKGIGITTFVNARLTTPGAEQLLADYREAKRMPGWTPIQEAIEIERSNAALQIAALQERVRELTGEPPESQ